MKNKDGVSLGTVTFEKKQIILEFNSNVTTLEDVEGEFDFNIRGWYDGDLSNDGTGFINIKSGNISKDVRVDYKKGGTQTEQVYRKQST